MFSMFKSQSAALDLTPRTCLVVSLIYCMGADGEMDQEEIGHLVSVLGPNANRGMIESALRYVRATPPAQFLTAARAPATGCGWTSAWPDMFRVRLDVPMAAPERVRVEGAALRHLRVARVVPGEEVEVFDGRGRAWAAVKGFGPRRPVRTPARGMRAFGGLNG